MAEARDAAGRRARARDATTTAATRARRWRSSRRSRSTARAVLILNTANRSSLPFLDERAVVEVPCVVGRAGAVPIAVGDVPAHARALVETIKDVERTTIDAALLGLARARGQGARAAPARAVGQHRARDLRRLPRAAARAAGGVRRDDRSTSPAPSPAFLDLTFAGLDELPAPGRGALRARTSLRSPGGGAITAVGAARLGLSSALVVAARRRRRSAMLLRALLDDDGVRCAGRLVDAHAGDRGDAVRRRPRDGDLRPGRGGRPPPSSPPSTPRAVVLSIPRLRARAGGRARLRVGRRHRRAGARRQRVAGRARRRAGAARQRARGAPADRAGRRRDRARRALAEYAPVAIVTLRRATGRSRRASEGVVRVDGRAGRGGRHDRRRRPVRRRLRLGRPGARRSTERLRWAVLYAALSVQGRHRGRGRGDVEGALGGGR